MKTPLRSLLSALALSGVLAAPALAQNVNVQTGTTYTFANTDCDPNGHRLVNFNSSVPVAVTLPGAGVNGQFTNGCVINAKNIGNGIVTITPTTSTIDGGTFYTLTPGASVTVLNDATGATLTNGNYWTLPGQSYTSSAPLTNFRNVLLDADFGVNVYSTGISNTNTGATPPVATYVGAPDTWFSTAVSTSSALSVVRVSGPASSGISNFEKVQRTSGSTSTLGFYGIGQEIDSATVIPLQGQQMVGSFNALADTLFSAPLSAVTIYVETGTNVNEGTSTGLSNAIGNGVWPPTGFTGGAITYTTTVPLTATNGRYTFGPFTVPLTSKEAMVLIGWTPPGGTTAGATDDFQIGNIQLEAGRFPSAFEHLPLATVQNIARQFVQCPLQESTSQTPANILEATGVATTTTTGNLLVPFVPPMRATPSTMLSLLGSLSIVAAGTPLSPTSIGVGLSTAFNPIGGTLPFVVSSGLSIGTPVQAAAAKVVGTGFYCVGANF